MSDLIPALFCAFALLFLAVAYFAGRWSALALRREEMLSRAQFIEAQQVAHIGSWEVDVERESVAWSDETYRILGLGPQSEPATLALFLSRVLPDDMDYVKREMFKTHDGKPFQFGFRIVRPDGSIRDVQHRGRATMRDGVAMRMLGTTQDITDQKAADNELSRARALQAALLDNLPDLVFLKDRESRFVAVNEPFARACDATIGEMIGKTDFDLFPRVQAEQSVQADRLALSRGMPIVTEQQIRGESGGSSWIETTLSPYREPSGEYGGLVGVSRDVTVRHETAERLRESARHYQLLFDRNPLPMWVYDLKTLKFLAVNDAAVDHYGYDRDRLLTMTIDDIRAPEDRANDTKATVRFDSHSIRAHMIHATRDGRRVNMEIFADAIIMNGRAARLVLARDVTQELFAVQQLTLSEERYRTLFAESLAGYYVSSVDGRLLDCNPTFARMVGFDDPRDACALPVSAFYTDSTKRLDMIARLAAEKRIELHEDELLRRDGTPLQLLETVIGKFDGEGQLVEVHGFVVDVTDRKRLEDQLRHSQKLQAVGQLAGGIAHDFNNLLTAMKMHGEFVLGEMANDNPHRADVLEMQAAADRATALTRQLLAFSRKQLLKPKVVAANRIVEGMAPMIRRLIGEDVTITIVLDPAAGSVLADASQLEQVVLNLAVNARDAMEHGGTFTISTGNTVLDDVRAASADLPGGHYVSLVMRDTGCGMTADLLGHIFEPFFTTKEQGRGTGLGLATVYGIVKQSGGHVWVTSTPGAGTTFEVLLPRVAAETEQVAIAPVIPRGTETILIVEDDPAVQVLSQRLLERQGYRVIVASNGVDALARVAEQRDEIALVLTDVVMPEMSGGELAAALAEQHPGLAVLFTSGYTDDVIVRRGLLEASASLLQKPFTAASLANAVRNMIDARLTMATH